MKKDKPSPEKVHIAPTYTYDNNYVDYGPDDHYRAYQDFSESGVSADGINTDSVTDKSPVSLRSATQIREDSFKALEKDPEVNASEIEISVKDGIVTLAGTVESRHIKRQVENVVNEIEGVLDINNNLRIDTTIASKGLTHPSR